MAYCQIFAFIVLFQFPMFQFCILVYIAKQTNINKKYGKGITSQYISYWCCTFDYSATTIIGSCICYVMEIKMFYRDLLSVGLVEQESLGRRRMSVLKRILHMARHFLTSPGWRVACSATLYREVSDGLCHCIRQTGQMLSFVGA